MDSEDISDQESIISEDEQNMHKRAAAAHENTVEDMISDNEAADAEVAAEESKSGTG